MFLKRFGIYIYIKGFGELLWVEMGCLFGYYVFIFVFRELVFFVDISYYNELCLNYIIVLLKKIYILLNKEIKK